jgi:hypothetical protein
MCLWARENSCWFNKQFFCVRVCQYEPCKVAGGQLHNGSSASETFCLTFQSQTLFEWSFILSTNILSSDDFRLNQVSESLSDYDTRFQYYSIGGWNACVSRVFEAWHFLESCRDRLLRMWTAVLFVVLVFYWQNDLSWQYDGVSAWHPWSYKEKSPVNKKGRDGNPSTRSTRQIKAREQGTNEHNNQDSTLRHVK